MSHPLIDLRPSLDGKVWYVYFAISGCGRYVKIGCTHKPGKRAVGIRSEARKYFGPSATAQIIGLVPSHPELERVLHLHFSESRVFYRIDWHYATLELMDYVRYASEYFVAVESSFKPRGGAARKALAHC